jgi:N6-L-threonylcarbamoyladenine synthase
MEDHFQYQILGATQDDACGEAFDKVAKLLGLPYPGGPEIARRADAFAENQDEVILAPLRTLFPRPMIDAPNFDFSFSGLKTAVLYESQKVSANEKISEGYRDKIAYAFQEAATDVLVAKTKKALTTYHPLSLVIAGGVSANVTLRAKLMALVAKHFPETQFLTPPFVYSLDNAAMIGAAAALRFEKLSDKEKKELQRNIPSLEPNPNLSLPTQK